MTANQQIAQTILQQLGGRRFTTMTGARDLLAIEKGLQMKLPANFAKDGINCVRITLEPSDTYRVEFGRIVRRKGVPEYNIKTTSEGIYCDGLAATFRAATGLSTRLF